MERADDLVGFCTEFAHGIRRPDGDGTTQPRRPCRTNRPQDGDQGRACGNTVIDDDNGPPRDHRGSPARSVCQLSAPDLVALPGHFGVEVGLRDPHSAHDVAVDERLTVAGNGPDSEFGIAGGSHLVCHGDAQFPPDVVSNGGGNGYSAAGNPEDEGR